MSIFPKRTIPGKGVTIHWNFNTSHLKDVHIFPFVRIGVRRPDGKETMLFEDNLLALPDPANNYAQDGVETQPALKYLNKNTPLLVLADYLGGPEKKEVLADILLSIQSGRHFYFYYPVPPDAPLGKYTLISEVHSNGQVRHSKTAADDFFFVESLALASVTVKKNKTISVVQNNSPEPVPIKIVECYPIGQTLKANIRVCELQPLKETSITCISKKSFLLYNEEREIIPLQLTKTFPLRNQQFLPVPKQEDGNEAVYVMGKENENAYKLEGLAKNIWQLADGLTESTALSSGKYKEAYEELVRVGLIREVMFNKVAHS